MKAEACRRLRYAAAKRLPVVCYPALFPGMTGPITLAGALAQSAAEILAGIVIHQAEAPGSPLISGSSVLPMDMRTVSLSYGSPEYVLVGMATVDYFSDIGVPTWIGAGCTDAHLFDAQSAAEAGANIMAAALSGTALVHNLGFLSAGKTGSLELLVACDDMAGSARRFVAAMTVSDEHLAEAVITDAGISGRYLNHPHTKAHVRRSMWIPSVFQRFDVGAWRRYGERSARETIRERIEELLGD
jgi:trimethylamine--corrinoid protein Co-methyltransferase